MTVSDLVKLEGKSLADIERKMKTHTSTYSVAIVCEVDVSAILRKPIGSNITLSALSPNAAARCKSRLVGVLTKPMHDTCCNRGLARYMPKKVDSFILDDAIDLSYWYAYTYSVCWLCRSSGKFLLL